MSRKKIVLKSSDGESFEVDEAADLESKTIAHMVEDDCVDNGVPLPNVTSEILAKVIEYCKKHVKAAASKSEHCQSTKTVMSLARAEEAGAERVLVISRFELTIAAFSQGDELEFPLPAIRNLSNPSITLISVQTAVDGGAANYLNIKNLPDLTRHTVADMIKGKTPEEIHTTFNIENDFTPEEEEEVRMEDKRAFE
ncbi:hypothetical protein F2Q68_00045332 [Brassica cretica]|uniref:SKP1-like protein n=1 Tax=Brassica cretica TaxID=69181 RepID=A0A8S9LQH1_BRACR|nr:hypothetical protein F2Q68_00045332 [Brassica cretica]